MDWAPVVIVGGGPVGLAAALILARQGIGSLVLEAEERRGEGSRAICIERHTLEIFGRLGVAGPMLEKGVTWHTGRVFFRDREIFRIRLPEGAGSPPPFINLPQHDTEQFLADGVEAEPLARLLRRHRVTGLAETDDGVRLRVESGGNTREVEARWVLAADGARSTVRHALGIPFEGRTHDSRFLIVDVRAGLGFPSERRFWFDPDFNRGKSALLHPQPDGVWRIDWQLGPQADAVAELRTASIERRVREVIGAVPFEVVWKSMYTFHQRCAARFRHGRVFLLGDAAHLMSPFGARGMNSGVQDAWNLGWKLALVEQGAAAGDLLDTYESERRPAALENLRLTAASMDFIAPESAARRLVRDLILRGSLHLPALRRFVNSGTLSSPSRYAPSAVIEPDPGGAGPRTGSLAPLPAGAGVPGFLFLLFGGDAQHGALAAALQRPSPAPLAARLVSRERPGPRDGVDTLFDGDGSLWARFAAAAGSGYLIRPDGHIAARGAPFPLAELHARVARAACALVR